MLSIQAKALLWVPLGGLGEWSAEQQRLDMYVVLFETCLGNMLKPWSDVAILLHGENPHKRSRKSVEYVPARASTCHSPFENAIT